LLILGFLSVAFPADEPAKNGWTSKELPRQIIPHSTTLSPDGRFLAEVITDQTWKKPPARYMGMPLPPDAVVLRDSAGKALLTIRGTPIAQLRTTRTAFSSDGGLLAIGGIDGTVHLIDVKTRKLVRRFSACRNPLEAVAFSGNKLIVLDGTATLTAWEPRSGKKVAALAFGNLARDENPRALLVAGEKRIFAIKGKDLRSTGADLAKWEKQVVLSARAVALLESKDHKTLAVGIDSGKGFLKGNARVDPKNPLVIGKPLFDWDYSLTIRDADTLEETRALKLDNKGMSLTVLFVPGRSDRVVTGKDDSFTVYDVKTGKAVESFTHPAPRKGGVFSYQLAPAPGDKLKTYCWELVMGYGTPPAFSPRLWTPPRDQTSPGETKK
jgi:WD40 repeat protein